MEDQTWSLDPPPHRKRGIAGEPFSTNKGWCGCRKGSGWAPTVVKTPPDSGPGAGINVALEVGRADWRGLSSLLLATRHAALPTTGVSRSKGLREPMCRFIKACISSHPAQPFVSVHDRCGIRQRLQTFLRCIDRSAYTGLAQATEGTMVIHGKCLARPDLSSSGLMMTGPAWPRETALGFGDRGECGVNVGDPRSFWIWGADARWVLDPGESWPFSLKHPGEA
ncbi:hypothetical protein GGR56DRAFT_531432 [Xylariaceae sp. FL0804]|nr:hypothetical protein GGR56DRAFT_531432 [Xylariaceae sp. FL0804]